ncbi:MAG: ABC transporter substrate-binding protein [Microthrixaceae bacterium]|nr:ABC transporter substrate-binding protein [Microthrixaceae bacterium]MCB9386686.1 ABC transporter substrate-binding protein [Microthrixaceae bacterium]
MSVGLLAVVALFASACGSGSDDGGGDSSGDDVDAGTPVPGGELVYGLEAETSGGWCLSESQLAVSGIMVARAIYDTLTVPDADGEYVPFLAESVESNEDYTQWTVTLRDGITFHDGTALDSTVVKNNIDSWRGEYPGRNPLLMRFAYGNLASVEVVDDLTLTITTNTPWPSLPAYLYYQGRVGIMAQAQLDDAEHCDQNLIGTGPFVEEEWVVNDHFTATKNPDYWRTDADGQQLPYLDTVEFRPYPEADSRVNALLSGQLGALHASGANQILTLQEAADAGEIKIVQSGEYPEVSYGLLNTAKAPFDNPIARQAAAAAVDLDELQQVINRDMLPKANGPFGPGSPGYLEDTGFPDYDPEKAKELVAEYQAETGEPLEFTFTIQNTPDVVATAQLVQSQAEKVGVKVNIDPVEQATLISRAIAGDFQLLSFRNHAGGDPDLQYVWWYGGGITNFGKFDDPEINALLDQGRAEADPAKREEIYQEINREFGKEVYNVWLNWSVWTIGTQNDVHGMLGPLLPDGQEPFPGLADGHTLAGAWISS